MGIRGVIAARLPLVDVKRRNMNRKLEITIKKDDELTTHPITQEQLMQVSGEIVLKEWGVDKLEIDDPDKTTTIGFTASKYGIDFSASIVDAPVTEKDTTIASLIIQSYLSGINNETANIHIQDLERLKR